MSKHAVSQPNEDRGREGKLQLELSEIVQTLGIPLLRLRILMAVRNAPYSTGTELMRHVECCRSALHNHLRILEAGGFVVHDVRHVDWSDKPVRVYAAISERCEDAAWALFDAVAGE
ncbi:ArsR family transcriptional regulator [Microbacterium sp. TPD7012]|uniref:ArsR family transcriptional regulator n=1 Tax=Microbacterium sp. TPD7012 TaxID=2171975 RepID=UPI0014041F27|nr:ArsR family transcriptional regulator [Microbacterium sp. TPD7012]